MTRSLFLGRYRKVHGSSDPEDSEEGSRFLHVTRELILTLLHKI